MEAAMGKSYFAILGVRTDATDDEIRAAYRKRAKEFHPDRFHGGNEPFRQIQEAYHILKDTRKREAHRRETEKPVVSRPDAPAWFPGPEPLIPGQPLEQSRGRMVIRRGYSRWDEFFCLPLRVDPRAREAVIPAQQSAIEIPKHTLMAWSREGMLLWSIAAFPMK
ncbi:MAG TPA: J domain-containing protein [Desulfobacteraceae bacterium]|nr:J domain-containing protein [Desulfobacteraceae bacterium]